MGFLLTAHSAYSLAAPACHIRTHEMRIDDLNAEHEIFLDRANDVKVLRIDEFIPRATIFLPGNLILNTNLFQRSYLLNVTTAIAGANAELMDEYGFDDAVFFSYSNLPDAAYVTFDRTGPAMWVYGIAPGMGSGGPAIIELGRSNQRLPVTGAYFFKETQLAIQSAPIEPPIEAPNPATGPSVPSSTFNPGTGL
jgi:hypothetical protein